MLSRNDQTPAAAVVLLYHFYYPDDVISARLFSDLAVDLQAGGYAVTAMPCRRSCFDPGQLYPSRQNWSGGFIRRVWRPAFSQKSNLGRILNALWMLVLWTWRAVWFSRRRPVIVIVGTDPVLGVLAAIPWRLMHPKAKIIHWAHDIYPEAATADGVLPAGNIGVGLLRGLLRLAYRRCDTIVDLGPCMRRLLRRSIEKGAKPPCPPARVVGDVFDIQRSGGLAFATIPPWALVEPDSVASIDRSERMELFGDAPLGLLYSGNLGRAHLHLPFIAIAASLRPAGVCFAGRGAQLDELRRAGVPPSAAGSVRFAPFADEHRLKRRLAAADIHLVSLKPSWTGAVLPSKFFGSLAIGRPVLFAGSPDCAIAAWIRRWDLGWVLEVSDTVESSVVAADSETTPSGFPIDPALNYSVLRNLPEVLESLGRYAAAPQLRMEMNRRCWETYHRVFSAKQGLARWRTLIQAQPTLAAGVIEGVDERFATAAAILARHEARC